MKVLVRVWILHTYMRPTNKWRDYSMKAPQTIMMNLKVAYVVKYDESNSWWSLVSKAPLTKAQEFLLHFKIPRLMLFISKMKSLCSVFKQAGAAHTLTVWRALKLYLCLALCKLNYISFVVIPLSYSRSNTTQCKNVCSEALSGSHFQKDIQ